MNNPKIVPEPTAVYGGTHDGSGLHQESRIETLINAVEIAARMHEANTAHWLSTRGTDVLYQRLQQRKAELLEAVTLKDPPSDA